MNLFPKSELRTYHQIMKQLKIHYPGVLETSCDRVTSSTVVCLAIRKRGATSSKRDLDKSHLVGGIHELEIDVQPPAIERSFCLEIQICARVTIANSRSVYWIRYNFSTHYFPSSTTSYLQVLSDGKQSRLTMGCKRCPHV